jgi:hypothetical protein
MPGCDDQAFVLQGNDSGNGQMHSIEGSGVQSRPDPARPRPLGKQVRGALGAALSGLKSRLEERMEKGFEIYIRTTSERPLQAITAPEVRSKYNFGSR